MSTLGDSLEARDAAPTDNTPVLEVGGPLVLILVLNSLLAVSGCAAIALQPEARPVELLGFAVAAVVFAITALLKHQRHIGYGAASSVAVGLVVVLLVERSSMLFLGGTFSDPHRGLFMPVFAFLPLVHVLCFALFPLGLALRVSIGLWLSMSAFISWMTVPFWSERPLRPSLPVLVAFLWAGQAVFILVFAEAARRHRRLIADLQHRAGEGQRLLALARESEGRFRGVFELAAVGMAVTDESGCYRLVNTRMADLLGYTQAELVGRNFRDVTHPDDLPACLRLQQQVVARTLERYRVEKRFRGKSGRTVHAEVYVCELEGRGAAERRFIVVTLDVTERKKAEQAAAEQRAISDFHFDHTPLGVVEFDAFLRIRRWSRRAEALFGWREAEVLGRTAEEIGVIPPEQAAARAERVGQMLRGEKEHLTVKVPMVHRSGRRLWVELHNAVTRDADGKPSTLVSMALDVTESQDMLHLLNESEARFRGIFNQAAVGIALLDEQGRWLHVNHKLCEITGYSLEELLTLDFQSITHPDDLERDLHLARALIDRTINDYRLEKRYVRKDGSLVWIALFVRRLELSASEQACFVSVVEDISERREAEARVQALTTSLEQKVQERTEQLRHIIRASQRRAEELTLVTEMGRLLSAARDMEDAAQVVVRYVPRIFPSADGALYLMREDGSGFERLTAWGGLTAAGTSIEPDLCWGLRSGAAHVVEGHVDGLHCAHVAEAFRHHPHLCAPLFTLGASVGLIELAWGRDVDGWAPELPMVKTVADKIGLAVGNLRLREELRRQALVDALTGLNNRRWFDLDWKARVARHTRGGGGFALLLIDVDHFKSVNDRFGHDAGDRVLCEIGKALRRTARDGDAVARFGGEEFAMLLSTTVPREALAAGERVRRAVGALQIPLGEGEPPAITVSIGVAVYPANGADETEMFQRADEALYEAKHQGRNQVRLAAPRTLRALPAH